MELAQMTASNSSRGGEVAEAGKQPTHVASTTAVHNMCNHTIDGSILMGCGFQVETVSLPSQELDLSL
jgi:secreted trypsin-like serine protease